MPDQIKSRVLSLDGGGTWATIQVAALTKLYSPDTRGHEILRGFRHASANSGGSIVLAGLLLNASLREIQDLFGNLSIRQALFTPLTTFDGGIIFYFIRKKLGGPRFNTTKKRDELNAIFSHVALTNNIHSLSLNDLAASIGNEFHFTIVGYDYRRDRAKYFRSNTQSAAGGRKSVTQAVNLVDAVHASSTAPVKFFDRPAESPNPPLKGELFWDGAITGQNNPIVAGVIEALANGVDRDNMVVLSLGTGNNTIPADLIENPPWKIDGHIDRLIADIEKLSGAVISDPPDHASFVAHMVLSSALPNPGDASVFNNSPIVRMNPLIAPYPNPGGGAWTWPTGLSTPDQRRIIGLDMAAVKREDFAMVQQLASDWIAGRIRNQPIRMSNDLTCDIGDETFAQATARWNLIK
jgi:hypothetical protein